MQANERVVCQFSALRRLIESQSQTLREALISYRCRDDLKAALGTLNDLLSAFTFASEIMQQILDSRNAKQSRRQAERAIGILRLRGLIDSCDPIRSVREISNATVLRTLALRKEAEARIDHEAEAIAGEMAAVAVQGEPYESRCNSLELKAKTAAA